MVYFIKSPKWSEINEYDTYWKEKETGYTSILADAGIYTEEDKNRISQYTSENEALFIPVNKELLAEAQHQLDERNSAIQEGIEREEYRHKQFMACIQRDKIANDVKYEKLNELATQLELHQEIER